MATALKLSEGFKLFQRQVEKVEPFLKGAPADWTATATSGTVAALDERGGGLSLTTQAADNAIGTLVQGYKPFVMAANKPLYLAFLIQYAEQATSAANILAGMHSGTASSALGNDGGGPPSSYSGFAFFKADGDTVWSVESSNGSTQVTTKLDAAGSLDRTAKTAGGSASVFLEIEVIPKNATMCDVIFSINNKPVAKHTDFVFTSMVAMAALAAVKAGSSTAEILKVYGAQYAMAR